MVALFKDRSPATVVWLFLLSIVVHSHFLIDYPVVYAPHYDGLLSVFLNRYITLLSPAILIFIYHAVVIIQALRLNHLFTSHRMFNRANHLPAMVYILMTGLFKEWSYLSPALLANLLVIWIYAMTVRFYNASNPKTLIFNTGLVIGGTIILYQPSAILILVALLAVLIVRPFVLTELVVMLMGAIAPFYFLFAYLYLTDHFKTALEYVPNIRFNIPHVTPTPIFFTTVGIIILVLLIGLLYWQQESRRLLIQIRKNWVVLHVMLFFLLLPPFINKNVGIEAFLLWLIPLSPVIAKGFLAPKKNTLPNLMFWLLLILVIIKNWEIVK